MLPADIVGELAKHEKRVTVASGTKLICQGDAPADLIILNDGAVRISVSARSRIMSLGVIGSGKVLGLREIVSGGQSEVDATTLAECSISLIPKRQILEILRRRPELYLAITRILTSDLKLAEQLLRDLRYVSRRENPGILVPA